MKVNFVSYLNPEKFSGGGEKIALAVISEMRKRGWKVRLVSARPLRFSYHCKADITVLCDIDNRSAYPTNNNFFRIPEFFVRHVMTCGLVTVHYSNAYVDLCRHDYLPCNGEITRCKCVKALEPRVGLLNSMVDMGVYLSPLHKKTSLKVLKNFHITPPKKLEVMGPCIDTKIFKNYSINRDIDYLFVGVIGEAKGLSEIRQKYGDKDIHFIGKIEDGQTLDFGTYHGVLPYDEIAKYMNRAKNFIFLPRWNEPQGRVVHEAALCGCNILGNENIGATSFNFDIANPKNYDGHVERIIDSIELMFHERVERL